MPGSLIYECRPQLGASRRTTGRVSWSAVDAGHLRITGPVVGGDVDEDLADLGERGAQPLVELVEAPGELVRALAAGRARLGREQGFVWRRIDDVHAPHRGDARRRLQDGVRLCQ